MTVTEAVITAALAQHEQVNWSSHDEQWKCNACGAVISGDMLLDQKDAIRTHQTSIIVTLLNGEADSYSTEEHAKLAAAIWRVETKDFGGHSTQDARFLSTRLLGLGYRHVDNPLGYTATEHIQLSDAIWHTEADGFTGYSTRDARFLATRLLGDGYRCVAGPNSTTVSQQC